VLDDEEHSSWCGGLLSGTCAESSLSSCRYPPYRHAIAESVTTPSRGTWVTFYHPAVPAGCEAATFAAGAHRLCRRGIPAIHSRVDRGLREKRSGTAPARAQRAAARSSSNAEVEPRGGGPDGSKHLIGAWQQDRWSNGGANGIVSAVSFDGGTPGRRRRCRSRAAAAACITAPRPVGEHRAGRHRVPDLLRIRRAFKRAMLVSRSTDRGLTWSTPIAFRHDVTPISSWTRRP